MESSYPGENGWFSLRVSTGMTESLSGYSLHVFAKEKQCPACRKSFDCGGLWFCWCRTIKLDATVLQALKERYADCLCRECLEGFAQRGQTGTSEIIDSGPQ
jgi:hypothetical protein